MAWNATGTFNRIVTTVSPAVGGTTIDVADQNSYTADVTAGINACLAKNGENAATGDIDLGSNQLKAVADGTLATDGVNVGQVQDGSFVYEGTVGGDADNITITLTPTLTAYAAGQVFRFLAGDTCSGDGVTLNVDGLGDLDVLTNSIANPRAGDISLNGIYTVVCDGSRFLLQNPERETDGVFVNNSNNYPNVSDTSIRLSTVATRATWESYGPTNSGAENIWTGLNTVPLTVDWIELRIYGNIAHAGATAVLGAVYGKANGGAESTGNENVLWEAGITTGTSDAKGCIAAHISKVPVDAANIFDLFWTNTLSGTQTIDAYVTGYGWN